MRYVTTDLMVPFLDELAKTAGWKESLGRAATRAGALMAGSGGYGTRMALAGGMGAMGGATVDEENRGRGALIGAGLGAATMGGAILSTPAGRKALREGSTNFWKRQKYSVTGKGVKDLDEARSLGIVSKPPESASIRPGLIDRMRGRTPKDIYESQLKRIGLEEKAFEAGHLHAPGLVKGMVTHPLDTMKSGWQRTGVAGKAFAGLGAYEAGKGFIKKPEEGGPGRVEKGLRGVGNTAGILLSPPLFAGGLLVGEGLGQGGKYMGRGIDRLAGRRQPTEEQPTPVVPGRLGRGLRAATGA